MSSELLPCPHCGAEAKRFTIEEEGPNFGGDVIVCTGKCGSSSHVEFGRKENLVSLWNERTTPDTIARLTAEPAGEDVERDLSGETVCGFRVAAYRETHPEHGDAYGHRYSEHWSTPNTRDPRVKVERLFTETQLRDALHPTDDLRRTREAAQVSANEAWQEVVQLRHLLKPFAEAADDLDDAHRDNSELWEAPAAMSITAGDLRRARAALSTVSKDSDHGL